MLPFAVQNLVTLSTADNPTLQGIPSLQHLTALMSLELYGCGLTTISLEVVQLPALRRWAFPISASHVATACFLLSHLDNEMCARSIWLEGNPLQASSLTPLLTSLPEHTALRDLGLDRSQVRWLNPTPHSHVCATPMESSLFLSMSALIMLLGCRACM